MASIPDMQIKIDPTPEFKALIQETLEELHTAREALSEERIRQIVRDEIKAFIEADIRRNAFRS